LTRSSCGICSAESMVVVMLSSLVRALMLTHLEERRLAKNCAAVNRESSHSYRPDPGGSTT
jgi:hypothetical protein